MAYTNIDDPSAYFQVKTYTGNGTDNTAITYDGNSDMQPDFLWFKLRSTTGNHVLFDSSRGVTKYIRSNTTAAETTNGTLLKSFDTDGFTVGTSANTNYNNQTLVSWGWKANGGTTSTNTDGSINTTVQSNSTAGFNIITYTGTGGGETLGHGLGVAPDMWIVKRRSGTGSWAVGFNDSSILGGTSNYLILQSTAGTSTYNNFWGSSPANSNVMRIAGDATIGGSGSTYVAYAFAEKQGYSKFGKYVGNGSTDGTFIYTGFKPAFVMTKNISAADSWVIMDAKRSPSNVANKYLLANSSGADGTNFDMFDFVSNGFKCRRTTSQNASGNTFIYMAFAESPFVANGIPTTAR